jgi:hypothetical protein
MGDFVAWPVQDPGEDGFKLERIYLTKKAEHSASAMVTFIMRFNNSTLIVEGWLCECS